MQYRLRCFDPRAAAVVERFEEAASEALARSQAAAHGFVVLGLERAGTGGPAAVAIGSRVAAFDVGWWCRELRTLLRAGMTVVEALETLAASEPTGARARVQQGLLQALRQGQALSAAMQQAPKDFPAVLVASVKASERSSALVEALDDYLRYDEMLRRLRKQLVSAAIYPAVVVGLGLLISGFLLLYVVPKFSQMYQGLRGPVSTATRVLVTLSQALSEQGAVVLAVCAAAAALGAYAWRAGHAGRAALAVVERIDWLQRQLDHFRLAKLYQSLALMFRGGYALDEALRVCQTLALGQRLDACLSQAQGRLMQGQPVSAAFVAAGLTDQISERLLRTGERTGSFDLVLQTIADRHAEAFTTFVERATRLAEPVLLMIVALIVGGIVVMMYMPVFDIASSLR
jgi:general secretion pathway protein F